MSVKSDYDVISDPLSLFSSIDSDDLNQEENEEEIEEIMKKWYEGSNNESVAEEPISSSPTVQNPAYFPGSVSPPRITTISSKSVSSIKKTEADENPNNNLAKLFAKLKIKLRENATHNTTLDVAPPPPPKPQLVITNRDHICFDCNYNMGPNLEKGTGFGYIGINLYFCRPCYFVRFSNGEGSIIDYTEGEDPDLTEQYRKEFNYEINKQKDCFNCDTDQAKRVCRYRGLIGDTLIICEDCRLRFHERMIELKKIVNVKHINFIREEILYYEQEKRDS
jgi:hypothetical protein